MSSSAQRFPLHVEGKDDLFTIAALLERHGVDMSDAQRRIQIFISDNPRTGAEGVEALLDAMPDAIRNATNRPIGFVLDIDVGAEDRWNAVCGRLREAGLAPPPACPSDGYIGQLPDYPFPIGVWMMPDCAMHEGKLENLLQTLIPGGDPLWPHAQQNTGEASRLGARFHDSAKANIHCWLAWQEEPGRPFGTAITAKFLGHDSREALAFLRWLGRLFDLSIAGT